jgi:hypothetical protein
MRSILFGLIALAASCAPAFAQQTKAQSPVIYPGAQRFAHSLLVETGLFGQAIEVAKKEFGPSLRRTYLEAPWGAGLDAEKKAKVGAYVDAIPDLLSAILMEELPRIETAVAIALSRDLSPVEAEQIGNFFTSEDGLAFFRLMASAAVEAARTGRRPPPASEIVARLTRKQTQSLNAFARTPGGRAFSRVGGDKAKTIVQDAIAKDTMPKRIPELYGKIRTDLCAIIGDPCPVPTP